ncbi:MAG: hypothetical protein C7B45_05730 [Sulfobacillus acidophilus]|uniref:ATP-binding protein n=1 Tax=Sulfobacillus acidophilus TaxID=53633 RepID=A0A2T2WKE1_9FIRM|nr:MAG: hypothetical protein C7B45_05730 [Sulfobacillus acidophilus]
MKEWIAEGRAPTTLLAVSGLGGIGKTALLRYWYQSVRTQGAVALWIDGRAGVRTPQGFLDHLSTAGVLAGISVGEEPSAWHAVVRVLQERRVCVFIDNFESLSAIEEWLSHVLWGNSPEENLLWVVAARTFSMRSWSALNQPGLRVVPVKLDVLDANDAYQLVDQVLPGLEPDMRRQMVDNTGGHPLALTLLLDLVREGQDTPAALTLRDPEFYHQITLQWLRELVNEALYPAIEVLALLDSANEETISAGVGYTLSPQDFAELAQLSFVQQVEDGMALHDVARTYLLRDLQRRRPGHIEMLRRRLASHLLEILRTGTGAQRLAAASRLLTVVLDALPMPQNYADLSTNVFPYAFSPYQASDLPQLQLMLEDWAKAYVLPRQRQLYQDFLTEFAERFPQDIRVIRNTANVAVAASFFCLVHRATGELLTRYFPDETRECLTPAELQREPEQASTYYAILVCVDMRNPGIPVVDLTGLLIRSGLGLLGNGTRVTLVATNPGLKQLLAALGFSITATKTRNCDVDDLRAEVCTLDLSGGRYADWIEYLLQRVESPENPLEAFMPAKATQSVEVRELRAVLSALTRPGQFQRTALTQKVPWDIEEFRVVLTRALTGRDPTVLSYMSQEHLELLRMTYLEDVNSVQACLALNLSRASYFRRLREAVQGLAYWLAIFMSAVEKS